MKIQFHILRRALVLVGGLLLFPSLHAQIDFSSLDKWRGWRPTMPAERRERPEPREQPTRQEPTWRPPDPAEERRREKAQAEKIRQLQSNWVAVDQPAKVVAPRTAVDISVGSTVFGIRPTDPVGITAPLGKIAMSGTPITNEALRRSVAILAVIKNIPPDNPDPRFSNGNNEEAAFLAGQAALAMEGAPLQVIVEPGSSRQIGMAAEAVRPALANLGRHQEQMEQAGHERLAAYKALEAMQDKGGSGDTIQQRQETIARFKKAAADRRTAEQNVAGDEIIILGADRKRP